jgi:hypothetical protein
MVLNLHKPSARIIVVEDAMGPGLTGDSGCQQLMIRACLATQDHWYIHEFFFPLA